MSSSSTAGLRPFMAGAITALSLFYVISTLKKKKEQKKTAVNNNNEKSCRPSSTCSSSIIMDSPDLDQRMIRKAEAAILKRTSRLSVVVERCTNDFNYSAILRTLEALGVQNVYIIDPPSLQSTLHENALVRSTGQLVKKATTQEVSQRKSHHLFAQRAAEWLTIYEFEDTSSCFDELRRTQHTIWATDLSQQAVCLTTEQLSQQGMDPIPEKLAIVFGTEAVGCTQEALEKSDARVYLPLYGFADSLNLSVATALVVHQLFHLDPSLQGAMTEKERRELRQDWFTKLAFQRLETKREKKDRNLLISQIKTCKSILEKKLNGEALQPAQLAKLAKLESFEEELSKSQDALQKRASASVQTLVVNPPLPLDDMRRADEHRTCFVGRNTKKQYNEVWKDMPATTNFDTSTVQSTASYFRNLAEQQESNGDENNK